MSLSAAVLGNLIDSNLAGFGAVGSNRTIFSNAVATGIVNTLVGKNFTTNDTGSGTAGTGTGTGVTGLSPSTMVSIALPVMISQGSNANNLMTAIMNATVTHLQSAASLTSVDPDVGIGTGIVVIGSFGVTIIEMTTNINNALLTAGANGSNRQNLSQAISTGIITNLLASGTGTLTITGGSSLPPGTSGTGTGTLS